MGFFKKLFSESDGRKQLPESGNTATTPYGDGVEDSSWVGVDLDGTLAVWDADSSLDRIGAPVPDMLSFVRRMVEMGIRVKIFTARAGDPAQIPRIRKWLNRNGLPALEITNVKDFNMEKLYDDRAIQVEANTGRVISDLN